MHSNRARFLVALFAALCLLLFALACSKSADDEEDSAGSDTDESANVNLTPYKPTGQEGSIVVTISFTRTAPAPKPISMYSDPFAPTTTHHAPAEHNVVNP